MQTVRRWAVLALAGCGGTETSSAPSAPPVTLAAAAPTAPVTEAPEPRAIAATVDATGRKWLTPQVPYDVYPGLPSDQELAATATGTAPGEPPADAPAITAATVASTDLVGGTPPEMKPAPATAPPMSDTPMVAPSDGAPAAGEGWDSILPLEDLQNEIAAARNDLSEKLLTVGSYNAVFEQVATDGWVLSALATIAQEYPAAISWKANALIVRDRATEVASAATGRGRENFKAAQLAAEQLSAVLNNNVPPGLPPPDPAMSREESADRASLMTRMQRAYDRLKDAGGDAASLKSNAETAAAEARLLAALTKFVTHSDYGSAAEPDYQAAATELVTAGGAMATAAMANDPAAFRTAFDLAGTACNRCHEKYRFEK